MTNTLKKCGITITLAVVFLGVSATYTNAAVSPNILIGQDMTVGSTGQGVAVLQSLLSELGYLSVPAGVPFGYFGSLTQNAVARYQAAMNVSPAAGYFGPITKASMRSDFSSHGWLRLLGW